MRVRIVVGAAILAAVVLAAPGFAPAQTRKVIEVTMTSFKFEPNQIRLVEGETVVLRLRNVDPFGRPHQIASSWLVDIPLTVRGEGREGVNEGRKFVTVEAGKQAEVEFTVKGRGSHAFICGLFQHAAQGQTGAFFVSAP